MSYLAIKYLHLVGAAILFGTGMGIAFFAWFGYRRAMRSADIGLLRGVLSLTVMADALFTATASVAQPLTGYWLWKAAGGNWHGSWIWWVLGAYAFVGACWLPVVVLQVRMRDAAGRAESTAALDTRFHSQFRLWFVLGWPAFAGVLVLYALMLGRGYFA